MRCLVAPPRLRTLPGRGEERHTSALELFFDLIFVVAMASLAELLTDDPSVWGFVRYGALFVPVWWAWVGYAFHADRFETDDLVYRLVIFGAMLAIAGVALTTGLDDELRPAQAAMAAGGFLVAAPLWWSYFTFVAM